MKLLNELTKNDRSLQVIIKEFDNLIMDLPPYCCYTRLYRLVNLFKLGTLPIMLLFVFTYENFSRGALLYTALHGSYGLAWILKHLTFPDTTFDRKVPLGTLVVCGAVMFIYYGFGLWIISGHGIQEPSVNRCLTSICLVVVGCAVMMGSDAQKNFKLKSRKGLISTGMFARTRNPNYLGEMMLYSGFATLTGAWLAWAYLIFVWIVLFGERIAVKEISLRKKPGWEEYERKSGLLLPKIIHNDILNYMFYIILGIGIYLCYLS